MPSSADRTHSTVIAAPGRGTRRTGPGCCGSRPGSLRSGSPTGTLTWCTVTSVRRPACPRPRATVVTSWTGRRAYGAAWDHGRRESAAAGERPPGCRRPLEAAGVEVECRPRAPSTRPSCGRRCPAYDLLGHPVRHPGDRRPSWPRRPTCSPSAPSASAPTRSTWPPRPSAGRRRLQRAVLQHPQRGRAGRRRDDRADPSADREERRAARRRLGQVGQGRARDARPARSASSATATSAASCPCWPRRSAWAWSSSTPPTSSRMGNAKRGRHGRRAARAGRRRDAARRRADRQRRAVRRQAVRARCDRARSS